MSSLMVMVLVIISLVIPAVRPSEGTMHSYSEIYWISTVTLLSQ